MKHYSSKPDAAEGRRSPQQHSDGCVRFHKIQVLTKIKTQKQGKRTPLEQFMDLNPQWVRSGAGNATPAGGTSGVERRIRRTQELWLCVRRRGHYRQVTWSPPPSPSKYFRFHGDIRFPVRSYRAASLQIHIFLRDSQAATKERG